MTEDVERLGADLDFVRVARRRAGLRCLLLDFRRGVAIATLGERSVDARIESRDFTDRLPPEPWAQGDPADSVYRAARNALNNGEYGRAARLFADISKNYPKSAYQSDARYYEALARYKVGTTDELKAAAKLLEPMATKGSGASTQYVE
ncbi:MAG TPA: outer membrane protein assembly factor BamD, partial [Gemmatimonadaceae bacterium]|nr:outer membrane protein assembly factor BamD [Gemmatimonadaceae bacterium]